MLVIVSRIKKDNISVIELTKIDEQSAGSTPDLFSNKGTAEPIRVAIVTTKIIEKQNDVKTAKS